MDTPAKLATVQLTANEIYWLWTTVTIAGDENNPDPECDVVLKKLEAAMDAAGISDGDQPASAPEVPESRQRAEEMRTKYRQLKTQARCTVGESRASQLVKKLRGTKPAEFDLSPSARDMLDAVSARIASRQRKLNLSGQALVDDILDKLGDYDVYDKCGGDEEDAYEAVNKYVIARVTGAH